MNNRDVVNKTLITSIQINYNNPNPGSVEFITWLQNINIDDIIYIRNRDTTNLPLDFVYYKISSIVINTNYIQLNVSLPPSPNPKV